MIIKDLVGNTIFEAPVNTWQGFDFKDANLQNADLRHVDLRGANLRGANLQNAYLQGANLQGAYLQGAYLQNAYLQNAYLQGADLQNASLRHANLHNANLQNASFFYGIKTTKITQISGLTYHIYLLDDHIKIGCEIYTVNEWRQFDDKQIKVMDSKALVFWTQNKQLILGRYK